MVWLVFWVEGGGGWRGAVGSASSGRFVSRMADGGWRMPSPPAVRFRAGGSGGGVGRLAEVWG